MRVPLTAAISVAALGCSIITNPPTPESGRIEVVVSIMQGAAYQRVLAAFVDEGANIASGSADGVTVISTRIDGSFI